MSMDGGGSKGGVKSDINVTPLVDVMLVLLIIMMIVAPLLQKGADVKLPLAANTADKPETQDQTVSRHDRPVLRQRLRFKEDLRRRSKSSRDQGSASS
jgi:biopolymer transport protein ExbD